MSLSVHAYILDEEGEMIYHDSKDDGETLAGFESYRTTLYGSDLAKRLGFKLLPTLAFKDIYAEGQEINQLRSEAEIIMREAASFGEQANADAGHVKARADNIRKACIRARKMQGNVVIW